MKILEKIDSLILKKKTCQNQIGKEYNSIKKEFEECIKDKSVPLEERWILFLKSPDEFNEHPRWLNKTNSKGMKYILECLMNSPDVYGKSKKIQTKELFEDVFLTEKSCFNHRDYDNKELSLNRDAMEYILQQNCGSFYFVLK